MSYLPGLEPVEGMARTVCHCGCGAWFYQRRKPGRRILYVNPEHYWRERNKRRRTGPAPVVRDRLGRFAFPTAGRPGSQPTPAIEVAPLEESTSPGRGAASTLDRESA